jgi:hypothetical protein
MVAFAMGSFVMALYTVPDRTDCPIAAVVINKSIVKYKAVFMVYFSK